jgi:hypothetical protein
MDWKSGLEAMEADEKPPAASAGSGRGRPKGTLLLLLLVLFAPAAAAEGEAAEPVAAAEDSADAFERTMCTVDPSWMPSGVWEESKRGRKSECKREKTKKKR